MAQRTAQPPTPVPHWYLRTAEDEDTHWGLYDGHTVRAVCGEQFEPLVALVTGPALRGEPYDAAQVCPACQRARTKAPAGGDADRSIGL